MSRIRILKKVLCQKYDFCSYNLDFSIVINRIGKRWFIVDTIVKINKNGGHRIPIPDYTDENVLDKVVKII